MASLALAKVPWENWIKATIKLFVILSVTAIMFLVIAQAIQWGPF